jgi:hypothetical protein
MGRVELLISGWLWQNQRQKKGEAMSKPVTIVLLDDRKQDAYGNCQANDQRILCHVAPYNGAKIPLPAGTARTSFCVLKSGASNACSDFFIALLLSPLSGESGVARESPRSLHESFSSEMNSAQHRTRVFRF